MFVEIILPKSIIILLAKNQRGLKILKNLMGGNIMLMDHYVEFKNVSRIFHECSKENGEYNEKSKDELIDFLSRLDMKLIKDVKVILHIGKNEVDNCIHTPLELYKRTLTTFDIFKGWKDKESEILGILENKLLSKHFDSGLEVLDMK